MAERRKAADSVNAANSPGPTWWLCAVGLVVALALPLCVVDVPPVLDYPNHLARIFVLAHPDDPVLSQIYVPHWRIIPNLGIDIIGSMLLAVTDVHLGGRLLLALSLFAPVVGVVIYHRVAFGRLTVWPLASGIAANGAVFLLGFMNFLLAVGLAFAAAALWMALRRHAALLTATVAGAALSAVIFFCHIFGVALFLLLIVAEEMAQLRRKSKANILNSGEVVRIAGALMTVCAPAALLYLGSSFSGTAVRMGSWEGGPKVLAIVSPFMTTNFDLTILTALAFVSFLGISRRGMRVAPAFPFSLAVLVVAFLVAPSTIKSGTVIDMRVMLMIVLLTFAGLSPEMMRRPALVASVVFASLIVLRAGYATATWRAHRADLADVRAAIATVEPGSKVMVARGHRGRETSVDKPTRALPGFYRLDGHLGALLVIERKAFWPLMFADPAQQPIDIRPAFRTLVYLPGEPVELPLLSADDRMASSDLNNWRSKYDDVLLIDPPKPLPAIEGLLPVHVGSYAVLYHVQRR